ncbi:MAG: hypothetical protein LBL65_04345 [Campylobacteraceae bacterium]|jgi:hypothetical protein|nr:hypothetical protein [Campylobacteraceae bacterium]
MANKKRRLSPKNINQNENASSKESKNTLAESKAQHKRHLRDNKEISIVSINKMQLALFCTAVMLCSIGLVVYVVFIEPLLQ